MWLATITEGGSAIDPGSYWALVALVLIGLIVRGLLR